VRIYMAGVGGMLGEAFKEIFQDHHTIKTTDNDLNSEWLSFLDFRDYQSYRADVINFKPDYLFHIGAHTSLEYCENNPDDAYLTNTISVSYAVKIANELNIPILYISTAGIFDGKKDLYDDWDVPNPLGVYARSKYLGEIEVISNARNYLICRAGWMMGGGIKDKKFIGKLLSQIRSGASVLNIVNDKDGTPTYTRDFASVVKILVESNVFGLYNLVCSGQTSRIDVANELIDILNLKDSVNINAVPSDYFSKGFFAPRPSCERLINYKLNLLGLNSMRDWRVALRDYITNDFGHLL
jgi:dTDP-4-dehydrorhamnose reductase